jgi:dTDP-4-amino-4,6-dideoxygalactose transaminase
MAHRLIENPAMPRDPQHPPPPRAPARPRAPLAPVLSGASFGRAAAPLPSVLDAGAVRLVTSGRIALALALGELGVAKGDQVLLPAYHSLSMVPPVLARGATPLFYKVGPDTAVDLDDVAARLGPRVKALVVTHYFGFPQDLARLRAFCDAHALALVEDCAHCFFGEHAGRPVGSFGDYAIASSMKFYPAYDGGALLSARHPLERVRLRSAGPGFEAKAVLAALELAFGYRRLAPLRMALALPLWARDRLWPLLKARRKGGAPALAPASSDNGAGFDARWLDKRASWFARLLLARVSGARIVALRRARYLALEAALAALPGCRPLFTRLPDGACPWLFPLWVDDPEPLFARLKGNGVPLVRFAETLWPGVDAALCAHSAALSRHVLSFPVHQELDDDEFAWMSAELCRALAV